MSPNCFESLRVPKQTWLSLNWTARRVETCYFKISIQKLNYRVSTFARRSLYDDGNNELGHDIEVNQRITTTRIILQNILLCVRRRNSLPSEISLTKSIAFYYTVDRIIQCTTGVYRVYPYVVRTRWVSTLILLLSYKVIALYDR